MEAIVEKLSALLEDEVTLFRTMLTIVQAEKEAVIHADQIAVSQICRRKENLILKIKIIEAQRERLMERAGIQLGLSLPDITLHALSQHVGQLQADRLRANGAELKSLMQAIGELNAHNVSLLTHSMELITGSLNFLENLRSPNPVYRQSGKVLPADRQGRFLSGRI